jgi:pimeloyl-ACP methyl ester carboxylesterase
MPAILKPGGHLRIPILAADLAQAELHVSRHSPRGFICAAVPECGTAGLYLFRSPAGPYLTKETGMEARGWSCLPVLIVAVFCLGGVAAAQTHPVPLSSRLKPALHLQRTLKLPGSLATSAAPRLPAAPSASVRWVQCPPDAQALGARCGTLPVPLDRKHPQGTKIDIYFEIYFHTGAGPAVSAILAAAGGPGGSATDLRLDTVTLFAQNFDVHDFLLIDDRGRGQSATIDCEELQHGTAPFDQAEADCAAQLGGTDSRYGTGDVAEDTDAVRAALGYEKVDYWGGSYGGVDVTAYATRFGDHLRSIVLDAPEGTPALRAFSLDGESARATPGVVRLDCVRSPTCSIDHRNPGEEFARLVQAIRNKPIEGYAHDANGHLVQVNLDESALIYLVSTNPTGRFVGLGEVLAAGDTLSRGDPLPLLRLGAEVTPFVTDYGDPTAWSQGDYVATMCVDAQQPWDWSGSVTGREVQFADVVAQLPVDQFAPFSKTAGTSLGVSLEKQCLWWQKPTASAPAAPPHPIYPNVPTLVLSGDLDTLVPAEEARRVAALFPGSTFVPVAEAGHVTIVWTGCSANLQSQFFETLSVGDISCTQTPETVWPALGRFPLQAADARPAEADLSGTNQIGQTERKVVTVAVATAIDALKRSTVGIAGGGDGSGAGLRAGTFQSTFDADGNQTTTLVNCEFARDVTVNGMLTWGADLSFVADLVVSGSGTAGGAIHVQGTWQAPGPVGRFSVTGTLGGRRVAVLVPEA